MMIWNIWTNDTETEWSEDLISLGNIGVDRQSLYKGLIADWRTLAIF